MNHSAINNDFHYYLNIETLYLKLLLEFFLFPMQIIHKIPEYYRHQVIQLYSQVLRKGPISRILSEEKCYQLVNQTVDLNYAWAAIDKGVLLGFAGYQTSQGSFTGASTPRQLCRTLGIVCFVKLILQNMAYYRPLRKGEMLHNGLIVSETFRKQGIGKSLLQMMASRCKQYECNSLRLDASISNLPALSLYRSVGYIEESTQKHRADTFITLRRYID